MEKIARLLTVHIQHNVPDLTEIQLKKIKFGLECLFSEASKTVIYLIIFSLFSLSSEFITVLLFFTILRSFAGGYHEETYWRCFVTTLITFSICLYIGMSFNIMVVVKIVFLLISIILAYIFAPVDHKNKPIISVERRKRLKYLSVAMTIFLGLISFILPSKSSNLAIVTILMESVTLVFGYLKKGIILNDIIEGKGIGQ